MAVVLLCNYFPDPLLLLRLSFRAMRNLLSRVRQEMSHYSFALAGEQKLVCSTEQVAGELSSQECQQCPRQNESSLLDGRASF